MTRGIYCNRPHPGRGETIVATAMLDDLQRKARAHDDYLTALRGTRDRGLRISAPEHLPGYQTGYHQALVDIAQATVDAAARRMDEPT